MLTSYRGSCHCGSVTFQAELDLDQPTFRCNCSICRRTRFWAAVARPEAFRLLSGDDDLTEYRFGARLNAHMFCRICGVRTHGIGNDTPIGAMVGVNVGCLQGLTDEALSRIPVTRIDGLHDKGTPPEHASFL